MKLLFKHDLSSTFRITLISYKYIRSNNHLKFIKTLNNIFSK